MGAPAVAQEAPDLQRAPAAVRETKLGEGAAQVWLFEPATKPEKPAPVVVFLHGWMAMDPWTYGAWIDHLAGSGRIVIYPRYQAGPMTPADEFTPHAVAAVQTALAELKKEGHAAPDLERVAVVGHSVGGLLTVNLAAEAAKAGLPVPKALMSVQPGRTSGRSGFKGVPLSELARIAPETLLLCVTGDRDSVCGDTDTRHILNQTAAIPAERKSWLELPSDDHGKPRLIASHYVPCSPRPEPLLADDGPEQPDPLAVRSALGGDLGPLRQFLRTRHGTLWRQKNGAFLPMMESFDPPNAYDHALWRLFDTLAESAFTGNDRDAALGRTEKARAMGIRPDGTPIKPMVLKPAP